MAGPHITIRGSHQEEFSLTNELQNLGTCFKIKHSDTVRHLRHGALYITTALAAITILGGVLGVLALNGINLGAINSIATMVGEKYIYVGLVGGISLSAIDTVLISSLTRDYYNKQHTQKFIDNLGLRQWIQENDIESMLEPGYYWQFSNEQKYTQPIIPTHSNPEGRPATWGCLVRDHQGNLGAYAFKTKDDLLATIHKLGYKDGEAAFNDSPEYTFDYLATQVGHEGMEEYDKELSKALPHELAYREADIQNEPGNTLAYGLQFYDKKIGQSAVHYYKTEESRNQARSKLIAADIIEAQINSLQALPTFLPQNSFWATRGFPTYNHNGDRIDLYFVHRNDGADQPLVILTEDEFNDFKKSPFKNFRNDWDRPEVADTYPFYWVESFDVAEFFDPRPPLPNFYEYSSPFELDGHEVFALRYQEPGKEVPTILYFKSLEACSNYAATNLRAFTDHSQLKGLIEREFLNSILRAYQKNGENDCWVDENLVPGSWVVFARNPQGEISPDVVAYNSLNQYLAETNLEVRNNLFKGFGELKETNLTEQDFVTIDTQFRGFQHLSNNFWDTKPIRTAFGPVHVYAYRDDSGDLSTQFFVSEQAVDFHKTREHLLEAAYNMLTNPGDCYSFQSEYGNILYTLDNERNVQVSFPNNLDAATARLNDVGEEIRRTNEYTEAFGWWLNETAQYGISAEVKKMNSVNLLPNEYHSFGSVETLHPGRDFRHIYVVLVNVEGEVETRYFLSDPANQLESEGLRRRDDAS